MQAVVANGGKQYRVSVGEILRVEKLDLEIGAQVEFDQVLAIVDGEKTKVGLPLVADAKVVGEVVRQMRDKKINIIKFRRRKHHMKRQGHRQYLTEVKITEILG